MKATEPGRTNALREFQLELRQFCVDGLTKLEEDLRNQQVSRGTWAGCVMSYGGGAPGSRRADRHGNKRNAFTRLWDASLLNEEDLLPLVQEERARRGLKIGERHMTRVVLSKFNWSPGADAADFAWKPGEICIARSQHNKNKITLVRMVDGEPKTHPSQPDGFVFEVEFLDGSGTFAINSKCIEPSEEGQRAIEAGRAQLGLQ